MEGSWYSPDQYQLILDSLLRMVSCMVHEEQIMGLCDEMTIAKKVETFVAMMQGLLDSFDMDT